MMTPPIPKRVLLVEDHPADVALTKKAFGELQRDIDLQVVLDGVEAMQYLRKEGRFSGATTPDLVLLDLNMPRKNGRGVLEDMRGEEDLRSIPVVVLTTSSAANDVNECYRLGANAYVVKPVAYKDFTRAVASLDNFWFQTAILQKP